MKLVTLFCLALMLMYSCADAQDFGISGNVTAYGTEFDDDGTGTGMLAYELQTTYQVLDLSRWIPVSIVGTFGWKALHDVLGESSPFKEINYEPSAAVVYNVNNDFLQSASLAFLHESTGEDSLSSAGWNRWRVDVVFEIPVSDLDMIIRIVPQVEWVQNTESTIDGIADTAHLGMIVDNILLGGAVEIESGGNVLRVYGRHNQIVIEGAADLIPGLNDLQVFGKLFSGNAETLTRWDDDNIGAGIGVAVSR